MNVLRGEMSIVGPRPLPLRDYVQLEDWHRKRYLVLPGLTGLWQVSGRIALAFDDLVRLDFYYLENWSIWLDISIISKTLPAVLAGKGAIASAVTSALHIAPPYFGGDEGAEILAVASAVDLDFRYGCTPAWWQLWKGLYEAGADLDRHALPRPGGRVARGGEPAETPATARASSSPPPATPPRG